jgi:hypothetical protein
LLLAEREKSEQKQMYIGNRLYELCMMQHRQMYPKGDALPYESFTDTFSDSPKDTRTPDEIREDIIDAFA